MELIEVAGYGDILEHFLRGVAFIFNFGDFRTIAKIFILVSLIVAIFAVTRRGDFVSLLKVYLIAIIIWGLFVQVRTTVVINDLATGYSYQVSDVPWAVAKPLRFFSLFEKKIGEAYETAMGVPTWASVDKGLLAPQAIMLQASQWRIRDPYIAQTVDEYMYNCIFPDILGGYLPVGALLDEQYNIWSKLGNPNPARVTPVYTASNPSGQLMNCVQAYSQINSNLLQYVSNRAFNEIAQALGIGASITVSQVLGVAPSYFTGYSQSATTFLLHAIGMNHIWIAGNKYLATHPAEAQAIGMGMGAIEREVEMSGKLTRANVARYLPVIKGILHCLLAALTPAMFLMLLTPLFTKVLFGYLTMLLWLSFWRLGDVVLNSIVLFKTQSLLSGYGYKLSTHAAVQAGIVDYISMAGSLYWLIPTIAMLIAGGFSAYAMVGLASAMSGTIDSAENKHASSIARGDFSAGSLSMMNRSFWNTSTGQTSIGGFSTGGISIGGGYSSIGGYASESIGTFMSVAREHGVSLNSSQAVHLARAGVNSSTFFALDKAFRDIGGGRGFIDGTSSIQDAARAYHTFMANKSINDKNIAGLLAGKNIEFDGNALRITGQWSNQDLQLLNNIQSKTATDAESRMISDLVSQIRKGASYSGAMVLGRDGNFIRMDAGRGVETEKIAVSTRHADTLPLNIAGTAFNIQGANVSETGNNRVVTFGVNKDRNADFIKSMKDTLMKLGHVHTASLLGTLERRLQQGEAINFRIEGWQDGDTFRLARISYSHGASGEDMDSATQIWNRLLQDSSIRIGSQSISGVTEVRGSGDDAVVTFTGQIKGYQASKLAADYEKAARSASNENEKDLYLKTAQVLRKGIERVGDQGVLLLKIDGRGDLSDVRNISRLEVGHQTSGQFTTALDWSTTERGGVSEDIDYQKRYSYGIKADPGDIAKTVAAGLLNAALAEKQGDISRASKFRSEALNRLNDSGILAEMPKNPELVMKFIPDFVNSLGYQASQFTQDRASVGWRAEGGLGVKFKGVANIGGGLYTGGERSATETESVDTVGNYLRSSYYNALEKGNMGIFLDALNEVAKNAANAGTKSTPKQLVSGANNPLKGDY